MIDVEFCKFYSDFEISCSSNNQVFIPNKRNQIEDRKVVKNVLLYEDGVGNTIVNAINNIEINFSLKELKEQKPLNNQKDFFRESKDNKSSVSTFTKSDIGKNPQNNNFCENDFIRLSIDKKCIEANKYSVVSQEYQCGTNNVANCVDNDINEIFFKKNSNHRPKCIQKYNDEKTQLLIEKNDGKNNLYNWKHNGKVSQKFNIIFENKQGIINEQVQKNIFKENQEHLTFNGSTKSQNSELKEHHKKQDNKELEANMINNNYKSQLCNELENNQMEDIFLQQNTFANQVVNDVWMGKALTVQGTHTEISDNFEINYFIFRSIWSPLLEDFNFWINLSHSFHKNNNFPLLNVVEIPESLKTSDNCGKDCYFGNGRKLYF
ncbi:putative uncharacterized protein DDB_G0267716 isoform X1 [Hydra vulgaris]|uniref:putative uncharacterized protein DDB_G0267716 isoform X1 n=1 Tax=Hydra vulgaris TaxID=6087 RepID=UPI001F5FE48B|nr:putative uncharacterized protein DDB_G0267716 [Hydra vulgaris]